MVSTTLPWIAKLNRERLKRLVDKVNFEFTSHFSCPGQFVRREERYQDAHKNTQTAKQVFCKVPLVHACILVFSSICFNMFVDIYFSNPYGNKRSHFRRKAY